MCSPRYNEKFLITHCEKKSMKYPDFKHSGFTIKIIMCWCKPSPTVRPNSVHDIVCHAKTQAVKEFHNMSDLKK